MSYVDRDDDGKIIKIFERQQYEGQEFVKKAKLADRRTYAEKRAEAYPEITDQLDALWKVVNQMRLDNLNIPQDSDDMLGKILAVKKKFRPPAG